MDQELLDIGIEWSKWTVIEFGLKFDEFNVRGDRSSV